MVVFEFTIVVLECQIPVLELRFWFWKIEILALECELLVL